MDKKEKQKFAKKLTEREIRMIQEMREFEEKTLNDPVAKKIAVLSDQTYVEFLKVFATAEELIHAILVNKRMIDRNQKDILAGKTEQVYTAGSRQGQKKEVNDLKAENIKLNNNLNMALSDLRQALTTLRYQYVDVPRVDGSKFFTQEDFHKYVKRVEDVLKEVGVDLYYERKTK